MDIKITVATPVYNREDCIGRCIESVLQQSQLPFEMLLVDDGSTDTTKEVIKKYKTENSIISLFEAPKNGGENYARNRCVENAKGDFILWLDSDDYLVPNAIESVLTGIDNNLGYLHYMFLTSDRESEFKASPEFSQKKHVTSFEDWLTGKVSGDFVHVMHKSVFAGLPFFEEVRGFPGVNFIRIHRRTKKQLFINTLVTIRDRNRDDALSLIGILDNKKSIWESYINNKYFLANFENDLFIINKQLLNKIVRAHLLLGISINEIKSNNDILLRLKKRGINFYLLKFLNNSLFSKILYLTLVSYVKIKHFKF